MIRGKSCGYQASLTCHWGAPGYASSFSFMALQIGASCLYESASGADLKATFMQGYADTGCAALGQRVSDKCKGLSSESRFAASPLQEHHVIDICAASLDQAAPILPVGYPCLPPMPFPSGPWLTLSSGRMHRCNQQVMRIKLRQSPKSCSSRFWIGCVFFPHFLSFYITYPWGWSLIWRILVKNWRSKKQIRNPAPK